MTQMVFLVSLVVGLTTALGWLVAQFAPPDRRVLSFLFGVAGGVVFVVLVTDLVPEVIAEAGIPYLIGGGTLGWLLMSYFEKRHHLHYDGSEAAKLLTEVGYLVGIGVALHNLFDGFGIGIGFAAGSRIGWSIALAGLAHNLPFGMAIVLPLRAAAVTASRAFLAALIPGLVTPLGTAVGVILKSAPGPAFGLGLAVTGGSMAFLLIRELVPRGLRDSRAMTIGGLVLGMALLLVVHQMLHTASVV